VRDLLPIIDAMRGRRVVVVGDPMLDEYVYGTTERISREAPVPVVRVQRTELRPGGAANAAANVASLGGEAVLVATVGDDDNGERLLALLTARGVDTRHVIRARGATTVTKTRILAGAPGVAAQQVARLDREPEGAPDARAAARLRRRLDAAMAARPDAVLVSDYGAGAMHQDVVTRVRELAHDGPWPVVVDSRYDVLAYRGVTAVTPNEPELRGTTPSPLRDDAALFGAAAALRRRLRCRAVLLTRGRLGAALFDTARATPERIPIFGRDEVADVTGAGDTVIAAFTLARCAGATWSQAARLANAAAGIAVTYVGAAQVRADQLAAALSAA
jgi:rfaE bifunctional protein kinase chain/domain